MATPEPPSQQVNEDQDQLLVAALGHAWSYYDTRLSRGLQVLNYFLIATAILATAYVSALNNGNDVVAALVAATGIPLSLITFAVGYQQRRLATVGELALVEIQDRLAIKLGLNSFRMAAPLPRWAPRFIPSYIAFLLALALSIAATAYALAR
ncbi:hypothetical protein [Actinomadura decatromicini]|uniref:ABC transporter permease n=1 Tax=Actinomadura decatromicini TaxID=2604572 RepID=A0A5D3FYB2_9ACTN|nr:hypothetical protein [Actinomadura decatromicini]TYK53068.1 hypothetical protein FXF68_04895 [Actinomadura decatromicini]